MYPTDNIRVTFELSCAAAKQLRELAVSKDIRLRNIGVLKVKISDGREISLLDQDNFKKPTIPAFSRKEQKNKGHSPSSGRASRCVSKDNGSRARLVQENLASITYQLQPLPLTDNSNKLIDNVNHVGQNCSISQPFVLNPEKKRVVLISQGTATEETKQSLYVNGHSNENFPPSNDAPDFSMQLEADTESTDPSSVLSITSETPKSSYLRLQPVETSARFQEDNIVSQHFNGYSSHFTNELPNDQVQSLSRVPENSVYDCRVTSRNSSDSLSVPLGDSGVSSYREGLPQQANGAPPVSNIYYAQKTSESSISTRNFQALQMLSDICVYETNMVSHGTSHTGTGCDKNVSVGCQTSVNAETVLSQNISIEFVDENKLTSGFFLLARYPKWMSSKSKNNPKRGTASLTPENGVGSEAVDDEDCGCATGNYHLCSKLRRRSRYRHYSSTSCHSMSLRSSDEHAECDHQDISTTYCEEMDQPTEHKSSNDGSIISSDYNNNSVLVTTDTENTRSANSHDTVSKSNIRFVPDEMSFSSFTSLSRLNSSPLAMLKGTVNRIPSPDVPRSQRDKHSPKNIVSEYTEIIGLRPEEQASITKHPPMCKADHSSSEDSPLDDFDVMTAPPPLLYKEQGMMKSIQFQKTSFLDTPPPLNESAVTALTCLSSRRNRTPSPAELMEPISSPKQCPLLSVANGDLSSGDGGSADLSYTIDNKNTARMKGPLVFESYSATSEQEDKDVVSLRDNSIRLGGSLTLYPTGVGKPSLLEEKIAGSSSECRMEKKGCDQEGAADGPRFFCPETEDSAQGNQEQRIVRDFKGVSAMSIVLDVLEEVIETVTSKIAHLQSDIVDLGNGRGDRSRFNVKSCQPIEAKNQNNSSNSGDHVTCRVVLDNIPQPDPLCKDTDSLDKLPSLEKTLSEANSSFVSLDSSMKKTETIQQPIDRLSQVLCFDNSTQPRETDTLNTSEEKDIKKDPPKIVDVTETRMKIDNKSAKDEVPSDVCNVKQSMKDGCEKWLEGDDPEHNDKNVAENSLKSIPQRNAAAKTMRSSKKGLHRKRLPDGTIVDDLSYVLKRIQGDDNSKGGRKNMPLVTRRQKRCLENQPRTLKRTRYSR